MSRALRDSQKNKLQNNYLTALTKHSRPILKPFLENKLIFTFLKNPKKSVFKHESKCISRALARLSKKKKIAEKLFHNLTKRTRPIIKPFWESTVFTINLPKTRSTCK